jgi:hypothetical protein
MLTRILVLTITLTSATMAFATTQDIYNKLWSKRAVDSTVVDAFLKPKATCVCQDTASAFKGKLGVLTKFNDNATCGIPSFDSAGALTVVNPCDLFEYIGK